MSTSAQASSGSLTASAKAYKPRHTSWPYKPSDFQRSDESADTSFYDTPRFVTHIDDHAIGMLRKYYKETLPRQGRILDFCSSWISHYPKEVEDAAKQGKVHVIGMGMNKAELDRNALLSSNGGRVLQDLNVEPEIPKKLGGSEEPLDAATCVVSIDYLTSPREVLASLRQRMKPGGVVHLAISNRCFPTKVVGRWLRVSEDERLMMVGDYLHFSGWHNIEILSLSDEPPEPGDGNVDGSSGLAGLMKWIGMGGHDPLWVVRGVNPPASDGKSEL